MQFWSTEKSNPRFLNLKPKLKNTTRWYPVSRAQIVAHLEISIETLFKFIGRVSNETIKSSLNFTDILFSDRAHFVQEKCRAISDDVLVDYNSFYFFGEYQENDNVYRYRRDYDEISEAKNDLRGSVYHNGFRKKFKLQSRKFNLVNYRLKLSIVNHKLSIHNLQHIWKHPWQPH